MKVNSIYFEFEPVSPQFANEIKREIIDWVHYYNSEMISLETGFTENIIYDKKNLGAKYDLE